MVNTLLHSPKEGITVVNTLSHSPKEVIHLGYTSRVERGECYTPGYTPGLVRREVIHLGIPPDYPPGVILRFMSPVLFSGLYLRGYSSLLSPWVFLPALTVGYSRCATLVVIPDVQLWWLFPPAPALPWVIPSCSCFNVGFSLLGNTLSRHTTVHILFTPAQTPH